MACASDREGKAAGGGERGEGGEPRGGGKTKKNPAHKKRKKGNTGGVLPLNSKEIDVKQR